MHIVDGVWGILRGVSMCFCRCVSSWFWGFGVGIGLGGVQIVFLGGRIEV